MSERRSHRLIEFLVIGRLREMVERPALSKLGGTVLPEREAYRASEVASVDRATSKPLISAMPDAITTTDLLLALCMMFGAALYSSVGHAGASSYIALMVLFGVPAAVMRPTALVLNIIVATLASARFVRAGLFRWRTLWPFLLGALPMAFLGGMILLPSHLYRPIVGGVLLCSAARLLWPRELKASTEWQDPPVWSPSCAERGSACCRV